MATRRRAGDAKPFRRKDGLYQLDVQLGRGSRGHRVRRSLDAVTREPWHRRAGARLSAGPGRGIATGDGRREPTRRRLSSPLECYRCAELGELDAERARAYKRRRLVSVRVIHGPTTLGSTLLCVTCIGSLAPLDPDPLDVSRTPSA